jgi:hypothetical protein
MRDYGSSTVQAGRVDWLAMAVLYIGPVATGAAGVWWHWNIAAADSLLAGAALLAGGLIAAFAQVASWRDRLTVAQQDNPRGDVIRRDSLDECVAHIVMSIYAASVLVVLLTVGSNMLSNQPLDAEPAQLNRWFSAVIIGFGSYLLLLMLIVVPKLWDTYSDHNSVPTRMGGAGR